MMLCSTTITTGLLGGGSLLGGGGGGGGVKKRAWSQEEDLLLRKCIEKFGEGKWREVPLRAGLNRCRKSCRLRWLNYLRPNINRGEFTSDEVDLIVRMHKLLGNRWSLIAGRLPGRTANDIKNYSNTHLKKMVLSRNHHPNNNKDHDQLHKAAADHDHGKKVRTLKPKAIKVLKPTPRTFSSRSKKLIHKQHFEGGGHGGFIDINNSNTSKGVSTNSTSPVAAAAKGVSTNSTSPVAAAAATYSNAAADEGKGEEEISDLLLTSFGERLLNSFCGDGDEGDMELMNNINVEHWDDCDLHLDDNLWRLLDIEPEIIM